MALVLLLATVLIFQGYEIHSCLPTRGKELTDSYVPVAIQTLNYYKSQLQVYYPYMFTPLCKTGTMTNSRFPHVCVDETMIRMNLLLIDLQREAAKQNLQYSQGLTSVALANVAKTSRTSATHQLYFILKKIDEEITNCRVKEFLRDLTNPKSKLFQNLQYVKPINYLDTDK